MWLEKIDTTCSGKKSEQNSFGVDLFSFFRGHNHFQPVLHEGMALLLHSARNGRLPFDPDRLLCVRLSVEVKRIGNALPFLELRSWSIPDFPERVEAATFREHWTSSTIRSRCKYISPFQQRSVQHHCLRKCDDDPRMVGRICLKDGRNWSSVRSSVAHPSLTPAFFIDLIVECVQVRTNTMEARNPLLLL